MSKGEGSLSVVIAEDDFLVAMEVERAAELANLSIFGVASNGAQAVEMVKNLAPDAVIMDIRMPVMGGLEAARRIKEEFPTPVVLLTAYESDEFLGEARDAGIAAYLTKPPEPQVLLRAVRLAVDRHGELMEQKRQNRDLKEALGKVPALQGLLPICAGCKRIRDDKGCWEEVEAYVEKRLDVEFSHGLCPECIKRLYPDLPVEG